MTLTKGQSEEFKNICKNQPVFAGNLLSHDTCKELREKGLVMYYNDDETSGYVLTNKGTELKEKLEGAFEIMCGGILYKPKGCTQKSGTYKDGCGKCGTGSLEVCIK